MNETSPCGIIRMIHQCTFLLDTNCINARQKDQYINQLEKWNRDNVIDLMMAETSSDEAAVGNKMREKKSCEYLSTLSYVTTLEEQSQLNRIQEILFPSGAKDQNQKNDVDIVFNALKYDRTLVTMDGDSKSQPGGILGNAKQLNTEFKIKIVRPEKAVEIVKKAIALRDNTTKQDCDRVGAEYPSWVGKD